MSKYLDYDHCDSTGKFPDGRKKFCIFFSNGADWLPTWEDLNHCFVEAAKVESENYPNDENRYIEQFQYTVRKIGSRLKPQVDVKRILAKASEHQKRKHRLGVQKRSYNDTYDYTTFYPYDIPLSEPQIMHLTWVDIAHEMLIWDGHIIAINHCRLHDCPLRQPGDRIRGVNSDNDIEEYTTD